MGRYAFGRFLKPSSEDNLFNAFFKSVYSRDSWVHYALTYPVPTITYRSLKAIMAMMIISLFFQLKMSPETRHFAKGFATKGLFVATLCGMSGISLLGLLKYMIDKSKEAIMREDERIRQLNLRRARSNSQRRRREIQA